jgi:hypothetical protein
VVTVTTVVITVEVAAALKRATTAELAETAAAVMSTAEKAVVDITDRKAVADITDGKAVADGILEGTLVHK